MRPVLFSLLGLPFLSWYVFFAVAGVGAYVYATRLVRFTGDERLERDFPALFAVCYLAGWLGARTLSVLTEQFDVHGPAQTLAQMFSLGPMTFYGGFLLAFAAGSTFVLVRGLSFAVAADVLLPATVLALGIGRIGCLLNGDDYGRLVPDQAQPPFWSVTFPGLPGARYPVQLEEACASFALAALAYGILRTRGRRERGDGGVAISTSAGISVSSAFAPPGALACVVAFVSALNRFLNENFRGDPRGAFLSTPLSTSQGIALVIMVVSCAVFSGLHHRHDKRRKETP